MKTGYYILDGIKFDEERFDEMLERVRYLDAELALAIEGAAVYHPNDAEEAGND